MPSKKVKRKFSRRGRQAAFARFVGVSRVTVSDWLRGRMVSARLERAARDWDPSRQPGLEPQNSNGKIFNAEVH